MIPELFSVSTAGHRLGKRSVPRAATPRASQGYRPSVASEIKAFVLPLLRR